MSLGVLALVPAIALGVLLASRPAARGSAYGVVSGAGVLLVFVAWVQRAGPMSPLPWLAAGVVLFVGGMIAHARDTNR